MDKSRERRESLVYHAKPKPGKIEVIPTKKYNSQRDLALAYSPGVAIPCQEIESDKDNTYKYTNKGNLVAVITNGTAVLGLGDIGPEASKPVMEGKALLFKIFADIDVFDIEINEKDPKKFVEIVKSLSPTFGGINLEDIKAPEAFQIEKNLIQGLDIPVMHDDQHGTAMISCAALINAIDLVNKKIKSVKLVMSGAGSSAIACAKLYLSFGLKRENIIMVDSKGVINNKRTDLNDEKKFFVTKRNINTLKEAMIDSDVFIGLSTGDIVTSKMLKTMAKDPIVFAMSNPNPEINYDLAMSTRKDLIMATGRSDFPNQVNNVLGFPFIFRGALDVRATKINEEMKKAAVIALANLAKKPVPEQVNIAYGEAKRLIFGKDYIIPKPFDPRLITEVPPAVAKAAMDSGVAREPIEDWDRYIQILDSRIRTNTKLIRLIHRRAKSRLKKLIFSESDQLDVLKAAQICKEDGIVEPILMGRKKVIKKLMKSIDFNDKVKIIDPKDKSQAKRISKYARVLFENLKRKGKTQKDVKQMLRDRIYFGSMMVLSGDADSMLAGYSRSYPSAFIPILNTIGKSKGIKRVSATNLMLTKQGPLFLSDTSLNINPDSEQLARIAINTAKTVKMFGIEPVIGILSFSNFGSSNSKEAEKISSAIKLLHNNNPDIIVDGPIQSDFALNKEMLKSRFPFSNLNGRKVNTLIFPNLDSANISYKIIKELDDAISIGPILIGLNRPVHILQLGASVEEIVNMAAISAIDSQRRKIRKK
ncbi:MAG TPA: NADP-dependent malic enzyme [Flavobacteriaceae bacterium]|jgi:malate dehydrogenase (oxaloacetate-decarboxylating)(NADP+)|nr:NADP-dependent malic enzyme [Flavobacteriaceae bacterium]HJO70710.1 NADP-dependent malic enzyme [Flavobacteriaceae bacterium]|tara:strand:- start:8499 stop:10781 length:2283 start_codon:yes stop_codon:yes gene_type:complete